MVQDYRVKSFKRRMQNYNSNTLECAENLKKIEEIFYLLGGVRGVNPEKEPNHNFIKNIDYEYDLRGKIESLERENRRLLNEKKYVDEILNKIEKTKRDALKRIYIDGEKMQKVATEMCYSDKGLQYQLDKEIKKALGII